MSLWLKTLLQVMFGFIFILSFLSYVALGVVVCGGLIFSVALAISLPIISCVGMLAGWFGFLFVTFAQPRAISVQPELLNPADNPYDKKYENLNGRVQSLRDHSVTGGEARKLFEKMEDEVVDYQDFITSRFITDPVRGKKQDETLTSKVYERATYEVCLNNGQKDPYTRDTIIGIEPALDFRREREGWFQQLEQQVQALEDRSRPTEKASNGLGAAHGLRFFLDVPDDRRVQLGQSSASSSLTHR